MSLARFTWRMSSLFLMVWGAVVSDPSLVQIGGFMLLARVLEERNAIWQGVRRPQTLLRYVFRLRIRRPPGKRPNAVNSDHIRQFSKIVCLCSVVIDNNRFEPTGHILYG